MASRPRHVVRWIIVGLLVMVFAAQCAVEHWPQHSPTAQGDAGEHVLDVPGYSSDGSLEHPTDTDSAEVTALLTRRSEAVLTGNETMFMSTVDTADRRFAADQRIVFANTQQLPLERFTYDLGDVLYPDRVLHTPSYVVDVTVDYQLDGYDSADSQIEDGYTFVKVDGQWRLDSVSDADRQFAQHVLPPPWDGRGITAHGDGRYLAVVDKGQDRLAHRLVTLCEAAARASHDLLGITDVRPTVLIATTARYGFTSFSGPDTAAITYAVHNEKHITGWRMKINPSYVGQVMSDPVVLTHELTHLATREYLPSSPKWLSEGTAEYVAWHSLGGLTASYRAGSWRATSGLRPRLPITADFNLGADVELHYLESHALASYVATRFGNHALLQLFRAFRAADTQTGDVDTRTQSILLRVLHLGQTRACQSRLCCAAVLDERYGLMNSIKRSTGLAIAALGIAFASAGCASTHLATSTARDGIGAYVDTPSRTSAAPPITSSTPASPPPSSPTSAPSSSEVTPKDFAAIRTLMASRARAVVAGNENAFMATLDVKRPAFLSAQRVMFENLQDLPVSAMSYEVGNSGLTPAPGIHRQQGGQPGGCRARVHLRPGQAPGGERGERHLREEGRSLAPRR